MGLPDNRLVPHNALDDAVYQAKQFERVLSLMQQKL